MKLGYHGFQSKVSKKKKKKGNSRDHFSRLLESCVVKTNYRRFPSSLKATTEDHCSCFQRFGDQDEVAKSD